ncbi:hypothetical protein ACFP51_34055 [Streptomyces pratens]|uniref:ATP-grasp-modified RiPP n=1 Tax=Streptomyces pratens TaxID=887456 RepID=A0ABW1MCL0_9ACTN
MTEWQDPDEGTSFADPVVAWAVYSDGEARAIDTDSSGEAVLLAPSLKNRRTYHPGQILDTPMPSEKSPGTSKENG